MARGLLRAIPCACPRLVHAKRREAEEQQKALKRDIHQSFFSTVTPIDALQAVDFTSSCFVPPALAGARQFLWRPGKQWVRATLAKLDLPDDDYFLIFEEHDSYGLSEVTFSVARENQWAQCTKGKTILFTCKGVIKGVSPSPAQCGVEQR